MGGCHPSHRMLEQLRSYSRTRLLDYQRLCVNCSEIVGVHADVRCYGYARMSLRIAYQVHGQCNHPSGALAESGRLCGTAVAAVPFSQKMYDPNRRCRWCNPPCPVRRTMYSNLADPHLVAEKHQTKGHNIYSRFVSGE